MESSNSSESANVPIVNTTDLPEDAPSADVTEYPSTSEPSVNGIANVVFATSQGIITPEQLHEVGIKTTHIVIHDQSTIDAVLKGQPITPSPTPLSANGERKFKYNWDPSVHDSVLPVRCRNVSGELHKNRFGSGGRGRCIKVGEIWYTPSEFEALCGRGNSKDWKRSIRYAGRTLQYLIEEGILQPHATSCTCSACCDDTAVESGTNVSGPIRLFTPYKRKKRDDAPTKRFLSQEGKCSESSNASDSVVVTLAPSLTSNETIQVVTATMDAAAESVIVTPVATPQTPRSAPTALDFSEQRQWWQLEEMVKNLVHQVQELQKQVDVARAQSIAAREAAIQQVRIQMENEKKEALSTSRIEAQMNLSRAVLEAKAEKEIAVQHVWHQARAEMQEKLEAVAADKGDGIKGYSAITGFVPGSTQSCDSTMETTAVNYITEIRIRCANCNREAFSECTRCHRTSYCSIFCQRKDWKNHQEDCGTEEEDAKEQNC